MALARQHMLAMEPTALMAKAETVAVLQQSPISFLAQ
jgi:hypothetical protein